MADAKRNVRIGPSPNFEMCSYRIFPTSSIIFKIDSGLAVPAGSWNNFNQFQVVKYHICNTYNKFVISPFNENHSILPKFYISKESIHIFKSSQKCLNIQTTYSQRLSLCLDSLDLAAFVFRNEIKGFHKVQTYTLTPLYAKIDWRRLLKAYYFAIDAFIMEEVRLRIHLPGYYRNWAYNNYVLKHKDVDIKTGSFNYNEPVRCLLDEGIGTIQHSENKIFGIKFFNLLGKEKENIIKNVYQKFHNTKKIKSLLGLFKIKLGHILFNNNYLNINYIFGWMTPYSCALVNLRLSFNQVN